jgi:hypothetical protein
MGQSISQPCHHGDDLSIATRPDHPLSCYGGLPLRSSRKADKGEMKKTFLKLHRADRNQKCILDPAAVLAALQNQADEIMHQKGFVGEEECCSKFQWVDTKDVDQGDVSTSRSGGASVHSGFLSDFAPSESTTATNATRTATNKGNRGKYSSLKKNSKKLSVLEYLGVDRGVSSSMIDEENGDEAMIAPNRRALRGADPSISEHLALASRNLQRIHQRKAEVQRKVEVDRREQDGFAMYTGILTSCIQPKDCLQIRREAYMSVLHLKMKAHLGQFYVEEYLPMFPDAAPSPPGLAAIARNLDDMPSLASDDSDSSSSSCVIDYGSIPPASSITSSITDLIFMDLAITGSLGLVPRHGHVARRVSSLRKRDQKSPEHYIVLMNQRSGIPLAVCALKAKNGLPIVRMYATKQRVFNQRAAATTKQLGLDWSNSLPLYAWAEIVTEGMHPDPIRFSIYMASGSEGRFSAVPSYQAGVEAEDGAPVIKVVGRTDLENRATGCAIIAIEAEEGEVDDDLCFQIDVAQGIDPALLICFTAVIDEIMEKSMRRQRRQLRTRPEPLSTAIV